MSIDTTLAELVRQTKVIALRSLFTGTDTARSLFVSPRVFDAVSPPFPDSETGRRLGMRAMWRDLFGASLDEYLTNYRAV